MEKLIEKVSQYQLLNYLIPGVLFLCAVDVLHVYDVDMSNACIMIVGGYFTGMVLSRIGSLVIEPLFKWCKIVKYAPYSDFVAVEAMDPKLDTLSQENNMYRTLVATFFVLLLIYLLNTIPCIRVFMHTKLFVGSALALILLLFVLAYRKQTTYIRKRINNKLHNT